MIPKNCLYIWINVIVSVKYDTSKMSTLLNITFPSIYENKAL